MDLLSFARPGLLWGLLGIGLPILIHLLGRRRVRTVPIGTLRFLDRAKSRASARWRLRRLLLLLARAAALGCLALLFGGPGCREEGGASGPTAWVLVLDTSPSMAAARGGASCLDRAKGALLSVLDKADPRDRFLFVTTREGDEASWRRGFTADAGGVRRAVQKAEVTYGVHRTDRALGRALHLLEGTEAGRIVLATDLQASAWGQERVPGAGKTPLRLVDVGLPAPANVWVAGVEESSETGSVRARLGASGFSGTRPSAARRTVRVRLDDGQAAAAFTAGTEATFRVRLPAGVHGGEVGVEPGGDLALDDRVPFVGGGSGKVRLLLVNGDPRGFEIRDELFFVRRALAPGARLGERFEAREVSAAELSARDFDGVDVALLANPGPVSAVVAARLRERIEAGMGLLVSAGDRWRPGEGAAGLAPAIAAPLRDLIAIPPNDPARKPYEPLDPESLAGPLAAFRDRAAGDLSRARVWTYWVPETRAAPQAEAPQALARLENGAPLLLDRALGRGRTLLLTTTIDRDGSDLCLQPAFIPWLERVLLHAAGRLRPGAPAWVPAGVAVPFPYRAEVSVEGPGGRKTAWRPGGLPFVPPVPGVYRVREAGALVDAFAAGIDPRESDLTRLTRAALDARLGPGNYDAGSAGPGSRGGGAGVGRRDVSGRFAAGLLAALALEALLSARWGQRRAPVGEPREAEP